MIELQLPDERALFVFDEAAFDPWDPDALDGPGVDRLLALLTERPLWARPPAVTFHLPPDRCGRTSPERLRQGLAAHAVRRRARLRTEQRVFVASNLVFAAIAAAAVVVAHQLGVRLTLHGLPADASLLATIQTGLDVLVWVALWVPIAALVQDWYPFARERRALALLERVPLTVACDGARRRERAG